MGRYLLIEFDESESAVKLKKQIDQAARSGKKFRVVGYFASPDIDKYCTCDPDTHTFHKGRPYSPIKQVPKTGWAHCQGCGNYRRPSMMKNLLAPEKIINPPLHSMKEHFSKRLKQFYNYTGHITTIGTIDKGESE